MTNLPEVVTTTPQQNSADSLRITAIPQQFDGLPEATHWLQSNTAVAREIGTQLERHSPDDAQLYRLLDITKVQPSELHRVISALILGESAASHDAAVTLLLQIHATGHGEKFIDLFQQALLQEEINDQRSAYTVSLKAALLADAESLTGKLPLSETEQARADFLHTLKAARAVLTHDIPDNRETQIDDEGMELCIRAAASFLAEKVTQPAHLRNILRNILRDTTNLFAFIAWNLDAHSTAADLQSFFAALDNKMIKPLFDETRTVDAVKALLVQKTGISTRDVVAPPATALLQSLNPIPTLKEIKIIAQEEKTLTQWKDTKNQLER